MPTSVRGRGGPYLIRRAEPSCPVNRFLCTLPNSRNIVPIPPAHIVFVFLDGVGLGPPSAGNPLTKRRPAFKHLAGGQAWTQEAAAICEPGHTFCPIDATLGVDGLPQSGTGQATLFTGVNCAKLAGRHYGPFPHSKTRPTLAEANLFRRVHVRTGDANAAAFANAYPQRFFDHVKRRDRWTVTTRCCLDAGVPIRGLEELLDGRALTADLTGEGWHRIGHAIPTITASAAGKRLATLSHDYRLTLFEYFLTDKAGHGRIDASPDDILDQLDAFFHGLLDVFDPHRELLIVTSDHGNIEAAHTTHTRHPVPLLAYGAGAAHFAGAESIADVTPALVATLSPSADLPAAAPSGTG